MYDEPLFTGRRFRIHPSLGQAILLACWIACPRVVYNAKVAEMCAAFLAGEPFNADMAYSHFKTDDKPWLREVPPEILRNSVYHFKTAFQRYRKRLARQPPFHKKWQNDSIWLTRELFRFEEAGKDAAGKPVYRLFIGKPGYEVGELAFTAHQHFTIPNSIVISRTVSAWFVSFSNELAPEEMALLRTPEELLYELQNLTEAELLSQSSGNDRGVARPLQLSDGVWFDLEPAQKKRIAQKEKKRRRYQRQAARRKEGSKRCKKAKRQAARACEYGRNVRRDAAHKWAYQLVHMPVRVHFTEALHLKNMLRRPKPKKGPDGKWLPNGAAAKAGLHKAMTSIGLGQIIAIAKQKAPRHNQLVLAGPCQHSSNECSRCHHIDPASRKSQAEFHCTRCGLRRSHRGYGWDCRKSRAGR